MNIPKAALAFCWLLSAAVGPNAQVTNVNPQVRTRTTADGKVTVVEVAAHFVTAVRLPEAVNAVAVGDPALFQVEHSEREPDLVLVKALTERSAEIARWSATAPARSASPHSVRGTNRRRKR